jgi:NAD(P)-dependent dehydrogenase (short-subunit alcohol dehydrogenase family)
VSLEGKTVLLTGASRGIGEAYVTAFVNAGAQVIGLARSFSDPSGSEPRPVPEGRVTRWPCDVSDEQDVINTVARVLTEFGRIDVLVNNAGIFPHHDTLSTSVPDWDRMMQVNVRGLYLMIREVAPHMVERGTGSIVNMSSGSALHTVRNSPGHEGLFAYGVSKAAVDRITDYLGEDLAPHGVAVNALRPGGVLTEAWREADPAAYKEAKESGRGQLCTPEVVGPPMLYLAEQTPATMTGAVVQAREFGVTWP